MLSGNLNGICLLTDGRVNKMIILKLILNKYGGGCGLDLSGRRRARVAGCCEHGNERLSVRNGGKLLD